MNPEAFSGPNKIPALFAEKVNGFQSFIIFVKSTILDVLNIFWILNTVLNVTGRVNYFRKELHLRYLTGFQIRPWHKIVFSFGRNSESNYIQWRLLRGVLEETALEILYFLKYMLEISYRNKNKITVKRRKGVILKMSKLRNGF